MKMTNKHKLVFDPDSFDEGTHELEVNECALAAGGAHEWTGEVYCGHNPFLFARIVDDLQVKVTDRDEEEFIWKERPKPQLKWLEKPEVADS